MNPSGDRSRHICLPEICIFAVNATEPALVDRHNKQVDLRIKELKELKKQLKILRR